MEQHIRVTVKKNSYHDSVTLMSLSGKVSALPHIQEAVVSMATEMNKELLANVGMLTPEAEQAGANDLVIAVKADTEEACDKAFSLIEEMLSKKTVNKKGDVVKPVSVDAAVKLAPEANIAIISVPGEYAAREAKAALRNGLHVLMFSDNVSLKDELMLKQLAHEKGLLMMGPDCGTAIINNVGLCFANKVRKGNIGVVGASGTGLQEVTTLIDRYGGGVSQVIGTGGRDLHEEIGGIMMLDAFDALCQDESTNVIVLISKPPAKTVENKILSRLSTTTKPVVICFLGGEPEAVTAAGAYAATTLEDAARISVELLGKKPICGRTLSDLNSLAMAARSKLKPTQKYVRGLYCGGTLCQEAQLIVKKNVTPVYSNIAKEEEYRLVNPNISKEHTFIDLGDDAFTVGRPHPMIEPSLRVPRFLQEARDPQVAVLLIDVVLGYGSHSDPAGVILPAIEEAKRIAAADGRHIEIIAYVCGSENEKQNKAEQIEKLARAGVTIADSNAEAAKLAALIVA